MTFLAEPDAIARFLVTAFFAVVFGQSAADKWLDRAGNAAYLNDHFKNSAVPPEAIPLLFWALTAIETAAGALCALGILFGDFRHKGVGIAGSGVLMAGFALLCLILGQRLAKDYAGAAVVAAYFAVAVIGILAF